MEELSHIAGGFFHGDDYIGRCAFGNKIALLMDALMGTNTTGGDVPFGQAEFLRTKFKITKEGGNVFLTCYRDEVRVFAKIVHGTAKDMAQF